MRKQRAPVLKALVAFLFENNLMNIKYFLLISSLLFNSNTLATGYCEEQEVLAFSCDFESKSASVCVNKENQVIYRFTNDAKIELEIESAVHLSRTIYSGGGEVNLTFTNGEYKYVVFKKDIRGERQADGIRPMIELSGIYVVKNSKLLTTLECPVIADIGYLPPHKEEEYQHYYSD